MQIFVPLIGLFLWQTATGYEQAVALFHAGKFHSVLKTLEALPPGEANRAAAQNLKSLALMSLGEIDLALAANAAAARQDSNNANYVYNRGLIQVTGLRLQEAERTFRDGIRRFPNSQRLKEGLGDALFRLNRFDEAEAALKAAAALDPPSAPAFAFLAKLYYSLGDTMQFGAYAQKAVRTDPSNSLASYLYGKYLLEQSSQTAPEGRKYIGRSIELAPTFEDALIDWGKLLAGDGDWKGAANSYERAIQSNPARAETYYLLYLACRRSNNSKRADWALKEYQRLTGDGRH